MAKIQGHTQDRPHDCLTTLSTQLTWRIAWRTGKNGLSGVPNRKWRGLQIGHSEKSSIDPTKPIIARDPNREKGKNGPKIASEGPSKKCHLLNLAISGLCQTRRLQRFKMQQRGDPYQRFFITEMKGGVPSPIKVTAEPPKTSATSAFMLYAYREGGAPSHLSVLAT